jgi:hypothetical protein
MLEFLFDTTRTVVDLVLNGIVARHTDVELIIPHAGATLPMIVDRVSAVSRLLDVDPSVDVLRDVARLHYDLAGFPLFAAALAADRLAAAGEPPGSLTDALRTNTKRLFHR